MPIHYYISHRKTEIKRRIDGMLASTRMPNNAQLQQNFSDHMKLDQSQLPRKINLRSEMTPVEDQSAIGSCVANAFAGAYEYLLKKSSGRHIDVSRLFIYYNARAKNAYPPGHITDSGCNITDALETLKELGTCEESLWPYDINKVHAKPNELAYNKASENQIMDALSLKLLVTMISQTHLLFEIRGPQDGVMKDIAIFQADDIGDHDRNYDDDDDRSGHEDSDDDDDDDDDAEISKVEDSDDDSEHYRENNDNETQEPQGNEEEQQQLVIETDIIMPEMMQRPYDSDDASC
ncbi:unnamed protein product [Rotaria magnacalcarata]|uniref:Peptidase C1A papain C-terminal domain-containing protein n=3 Tax=Rotaria magnacalcarata TaxID=392030 RepID=A0A816R778_9BILA|nr:unnamed protein product [Rotaria magnacalcarata]